MATTRLPFAEAHRQARAEHALTQQEAAARIGVSLRTIQNWEGGIKEPNLRQLEKCADVYGWPLPFLETPPTPVLVHSRPVSRPVTRSRKAASAGNRYFQQMPSTQQVRVAS